MARKYIRGQSLQQLSDELGISAHDIGRLLLGHGVTLRRRGGPRPRYAPPAVHIKKQTYETVADVIAALAEAGMDLAQISEATGRSCSYVSDRLAEAGIETGRSRPDSLGIDTARLAAAYRSIPSSAVLAEIFHTNPRSVLVRLRKSHAPIRARGGYWRHPADQDTTPVRAPLPPSPWEVRDREILKRFQQRRTTSQITHELGISSTEVDAAIRYHRSPDRTSAEIIRRSDEGESSTRIAARMGIRMTTVIDVLSAKKNRQRGTCPPVSSDSSSARSGNGKGSS
ncbi:MULTISPECIES: hypothetical protein [unclassified Streptomyces]|uniref:hypothetical protein n=1 Tax=unclassified Streptomyces TaxID=2593676 RepID=UPI00114CDF93|nr:hypothetical protein [Streptomyces sp. SID4917]